MARTWPIKPKFCSMCMAGETKFRVNSAMHISDYTFRHYVLGLLSVVREIFGRHAASGFLSVCMKSGHAIRGRTQIRSVTSPWCFLTDSISGVPGGRWVPMSTTESKEAVSRMTETSLSSAPGRGTTKEEAPRREARYRGVPSPLRRAAAVQLANAPPRVRAQPSLRRLTPTKITSQRVHVGE